MIDRTIKNIKKYFNTLEGILTAKISEKNTLQGILTPKIANIYIYMYLPFLYIKGLNIKMSLISAEGYKNAGVSHLIIKETGELWVSMKDF